MQCIIYKSLKKSDTYIYLAQRDDFSCLPEALRNLLGTPLHVMDLELHPGRRLAQEDSAEVLNNLQQRGWHLQIPRSADWLDSNAHH